ncbi:transcription repressor OFP4 [Senna tora]|uniref:Transcription repressor n=1 Tax=Senna tora TaxID=362788 RepID=A0A834T6B4_9FABA|nr:transcription repressor OFP4 [Senna tora]
MGNHRFRFSDMLPNAWFYKLKDMSRSRKQRNSSHAVKKNKASSSSPAISQVTQPKCLHYFPNETYRAGKLFNSPIHTKFTDFPFTDSSRRSSSKRRFRRKTIYKPSPSVASSVSATSCSCHWTTRPNQTRSPDYYASSSMESSSDELDLYECLSSESDDECDDNFVAPELFNGLSSDCSCRVSSSTNDIIIDMNHESFTGNPEKLDGFDPVSQFGLAPILTKPVRFDDKVIEASKLEESSRSTVARKSSASSRGIRLRVNSPKLASRRVQACARRKSVSSSSSSACKVSRNTGLPEGFAVVKSSIDPQRDFRESMVEMIMENNIWESEDLEDLLACYLSLNSREYHQLIIKAFEQIWFDMPQLRM